MTQNAKKSSCEKEYNATYQEKRREYNRRYYADSKKYLSQYHKEQWKLVKEARKAAMRRYFSRNVELYAEEQSVIKKVRMARGWSQKRLADEIGKTVGAVSHYESGRVKAPWDKLIAVMPELKEARK